MTILYLYWTNI